MRQGEEEEEEETGARKLVSLIDKATTSTDPDVDPVLLKAIKTRVRYSQSELRIAAQTLIDYMKRPHSQIRYLSLLIIDQLFMRSVEFRTIMSEQLDRLLSLSIGFRRNQPLPPPSSVAGLLRTKAIELLEKWHHTYGAHYRHLRLGYNYLKNNLKLQFPNRTHAREREERELRTQQLLRDKFESLRGNLPSIVEEIRSTVDEIMRCLEIVRSNHEDGDVAMEPLDDVKGDEEEVIHNPELRQIRLDSLMEGEKVEENSENKAVFDVLRELYKLLVTKHMVMIQQCLSLLVRVEVDDTRFRDSTLKGFIDLRNQVLDAKAKCEESRCVLPRIEEDGGGDDVVWEEAKVDESTQPKRIVKPTSSTSKVEDVPECSNARVVNSVKKTGEEGRQHDDSDSNPLRRKLLGEAPVVKWGSSLDNWGGNKHVLANHRGLELDSHWGRVDYDATIPADKIAQLNVQATIYREEQTEIQPCRAPLRKGGLCPRRDLKVCPFHGPIVPRDDQGKPIHPPVDAHVERKPMASMEEVDLDDENMVALQVAKQAVKNVRERDREDAEKKAIDKRAAKRAKLAQVREHNEMVLREAAMTSTSRSAGIGETSDTTSSARRKKPTLASMLHKKVTTKDRLAQKLLSSRARDSTVKQLTLGEDASYRESFPNQW